MSLPDNYRRAMERKPVYANADYHDQRTSAEHKPVSRLPLAHDRAIQKEDVERIRVRVCSYACRLRDADNLFVKHVLDFLRRAAIIPDDSPEHITLEVSQVRVKTKAEEKTVITVT